MRKARQRVVIRIAPLTTDEKESDRRLLDGSMIGVEQDVTKMVEWRAE